MNLFKKWNEIIKNNEKASAYHKELVQREAEKQKHLDAVLHDGYDAVAVMLTQMKEHKMIDQSQFELFMKVNYQAFKVKHDAYDNTADLMDGIFEEINNPNYRFICCKRRFRDSYTEHILEALYHSKADRIIVTTKYNTYVIVYDLKKVLTQAKPILTKGIAAKEKEMADFKEQHKESFELLEKIKEAKKVVYSDWHNLSTAKEREIRNFKHIVNFIDEELEKL